MEYVRSISAVTEQPFSPIFPVGRAAHYPDFQLEDKDFNGLMEFIRQTRQEGKIMARDLRREPMIEYIDKLFK